MAIMDIIMPRMDGLELCRKIRSVSEEIPLIFLTSRDEEFDRVLGLELGADDYLCKPFSTRELIARIKENPDVPAYRVMLHSRLASALSPFLLLLVGVPVLVGFENSLQSRFVGVIMCILVAGAYYVLTFVFGSMGNTGTISPVLAGWLPVLMTGVGGLWLFEAMLT